MKSIKVSDSPLAEEDDENDDGDGDDEEEFSGVQVNHLLSKLGNQLQQRARAKKQRMDELFKGKYVSNGSLLHGILPRIHYHVS
jgi:hypothetical protein